MQDYPVGEVEDIETQELDYKVKSLPTTHLVLPIRASNEDKTTWNVVLQMVEKRLARWPKRYFSK